MTTPIDPELEAALAQALFEDLEDARDMGGRRYAGRLLADSFRHARLAEVHRALGHCCCLCAAGYKRVRRDGETLHEHPGSDPFEACAAPDELVARFEALDAIPDTNEPAKERSSPWRSEPPTKPGWYWLKLEGCEAEPVELTHSGHVLFGGQIRRFGPRDLKAGARWLGPITPPAPPEVPA